MAQIEYNDLNKFYVSIGVTLLALTFILPWLFMKENFNLLISTADLNKCTRDAQRILIQRQSIVGLFSIIIPVASAITFSVGLFLIYRGIKGWRKLHVLMEAREKLANEIQVLTQEREILTNKKLSIEITTLSKEEKNEKVEKEAQLIQAQNTTPVETINSYSLQAYKERYYLIERKFQGVIVNACSDSFKIYKDAKIGENEFDLLLNSLHSDILIETKYVEGRIQQKFLRQYIDELQKRLAFYKATIKPKAKARLVFLLTQSAISAKGPKDTDLDYKILSLLKYQNQNLRDEDIKIAYFEVEKLDGYSKNEIIEKLEI